MYHVSAQGIDERMINVHYYYYCYYYYCEVEMIKEEVFIVSQRKKEEVFIVSQRRSINRESPTSHYFVLLHVQAGDKKY